MNGMRMPAFVIAFVYVFANVYLGYAFKTIRECEKDFYVNKFAVNACDTQHAYFMRMLANRCVNPVEVDNSSRSLKIKAKNVLFMYLI